MQLVVRGVWRPVQLEGPEKSFDYSRGCGSQRDQGGSCSRSGERCVRASRVCSQIADLVDTVFEGLNMTDGLRRFIEVDDQEVVKIGDLKSHKEVLKVVAGSTRTSERRWTIGSPIGRGGTKIGARFVKPFTWASNKRSGQMCAVSLWK